MQLMINRLYEKYPELLLLILGSFIFLANLGSLYVNVMEARNFVSAREMLTHGHWIFTTLNNLPRYEKPPLPTWLTAISAWFFGIKSVFAYRLPAALCSLFLMQMFFRLQLELKIAKFVAFFGTLILATSFYIVFSGRDGQWDIFTHTFMVAGCYYFIKMLKSESFKLKNVLIGGLFLGASLLSKGPVSVYALFLPFLISYAIVFKMRMNKRNWQKIAIFVAVGIASSLWWSLLVHYKDPGAFAEIAGRESSRWFNYNVRPIWYYWSFFTQSGIWTIPVLLGLFYWHLKKKVSNPKVYRFYFLWTILSLFLLSIIPEKKSRYLLPVLIPLAMTTVFYAEYAIKNFKLFSKFEKYPLYTYFLLLAVIAFAAPFVVYIALGKIVFEMGFTYLVFSFLMLALSVAFVYALRKINMKLLFSLAIAMIMIITLFGFPLLKLINPELNTFNISDIKKVQKQEKIKIYEASGTLPELIWHYGEPLPIAEKTAKIPDSEKDKFGILLGEFYNPDWKQKFKGYHFRLVDTLNLNPTLAKKPNPRLLREFYIASKH